MATTISFPTLLCLIFIVLKLTNCITWPWLWVLSPLWIPLAIAITIGFFVILIGIICVLRNV